ncbi:prolyl oligopeptidase family serine peptidase [Maribacter sp. X9]|uniref:prolyl oligopeptidase family serine peptidase n=1 Tax=Maribacter sp. X9 TaxID=3402159 RepID=UPI003AF3C9A0
MKYKILSFLFLILLLQPIAVLAIEPGTSQNENIFEGNYTLILEGYDWGPAAKKVVIPMSETITETKASDFKVTVQRSLNGVEMSPAEASGSREVLFVYISDENGHRIPEGKHVTLVLMVHPNNPLDSPIKYVVKEGRGANQWIDYKLKINHTPSSKIWDTEAARIYNDLNRFDLSGTHSFEGTNLTYGSFTPKITSKKSPLIIWLHGGGEGGTDPSIPLVANKATNYATPEIQAFFNGAFVLAPQSPTFWMQSVDGDYTRGDKEDIYNKALFNLIETYVSEHPQIDTNRIYIGGCSNGGYMSLKLILEHPDYFAAGYISALAYSNEYITDDEVERIKNVPIWFVHSKDDTTTVPEQTVLPLYQRLIAVGAPNTHLSYYDHVIDLTGVYGGDAYYFPGHWSWIYSHANDADFDFNGEPVLKNGRPITIMEWLSNQKK